MLRRVGAALLCSLAIAGCAERTSILVEVTSTLEVPDRVDGLALRVTGDRAGAIVDREYALDRGWPHTISLRPGRTESEGVTIRVTGTRGGAFVVQRTVRSAFVSGEQVVVRVELDAACAGVQCREGDDCVGGRCGSMPLPDGGVPDGGASDAGCRGPSDCDDRVACTIDTCSDGRCLHAPDDDLCEEGATCDAIDGCPPRVCEGDSQCADNSICNGTEVCGAGMTCERGTPIDCDDGNACTTDRCDEQQRGECSHRTKDADDDGFGDAACPAVGGVAATDCNDDNPDVRPGEVDDCNGLDDDCNGTCDTPFTCCRGEIGPCMTTCGTTGTRVCGGTCSWSVCSPPAEMCNGTDDDCNGAPDDVFACVRGRTESCTTACGSTGMRTCGDDCTWSACAAPGEVCNGTDDDCSGAPDDTFACVRGATTTCTTSCNSTGTRTCGATCELGACVPPAEGCNMRDDDCDSRIDETTECVTGTSRSCTTTCGTTGMQTCGAACTYGACVPPVETCNGDDDDCDGRIDETFTCVPNSTSTCTTGCATTGTRTCTNSCTWGACTAPVETCNGRDEDCDSMCDETFACCAGTSGSCTTSCGSTGSRTCSNACGWSVCSPPAETCNGADDDCNGTCDDTFECCRGRSSACTTSCGSTGSRTCSNACGWGTCAPPAETCSGVDDDCDNVVDEGFACTPNATSSCTTTCNSTGSRVCTAACAWGACAPPNESCNGVDDDCDGTSDEGCGTCSGCGGAVTVSAPGGRYNVSLGTHVNTGSCGGAGSEGYLTFTLTAASDVFIATHQVGSIDTVLYVRQCTCSGTEVAGACNDNADGRTTSRLRLTNLPAGTYNVIVDTKVAMTGTVPVDLYITPSGTESDRCGNPTMLAAGTTALSGSTCAFSGDYDSVVATGCSFAPSGDGQERVFAFYLPSARTVTFNGCQSASNYDSTFYVRSVCSDGAAGAQSGCNDDGCSGATTCGGTWRSSLTVSLPAGLHYLFVDAYDSGEGDECPCGNYAMAISGL